MPDNNATTWALLQTTQPPQDGDPHCADDSGRKHDALPPLLRHEEELCRKTLVRSRSLYVAALVPDQAKSVLIDQKKNSVG